MIPSPPTRKAGFVSFAVAALLFCLGPPSAAWAQPDNSANSTLSGAYYVRQVALYSFDRAGKPGRARALTGIATFDGKGAYALAGSLVDTQVGPIAQPYTVTGTYSVGSNGLFQIQNPINTKDTDFGGVGAAGPSAFVASATEGQYNDILVGIPMPASLLSLGSFNGTYRAGYIDYLQADVTKVRNAVFNFSPNGQGSIGAVAVTGYAANMGSTSLTQNVTGVTYSIDAAAGVGNLIFGAESPSQLISGTKVIVPSRDGSVLLGGGTGFDLFFAVRPFSGPNPNESYAGTYYYAQLSDDASGLPKVSVVNSNYGSINATGTGLSLVHQRYDEDGLYAYDSTYSTEHSLDATGNVSVDGGSEFIGGGGQTFVVVGGNSYYTLLIGFQAAQYSGKGTFIYPTAVVNAATFAPVTNPVARGEYLSIFGANLAPGTFPQAGQSLPAPFPTSLGGVQVTVNGRNAPMYYASPTQISFIVPSDIGGSFTKPATNAVIQVNNNGINSNPVTLGVALTAPGVWTAGANGISMGLVQKAPDFSLVSASNPVKPGDVIVIYCTGLGPVTPAVADGAVAGSTTLSRVNFPAFVYIDNQPAKVSFAGLTPGFVSLYQINATVPDGITRGATVALDVEIDDSSGDTLAYTSEAKIAIAPNL